MRLIPKFERTEEGTVEVRLLGKDKDIEADWYLGLSSLKIIDLYPKHAGEVFVIELDQQAVDELYGMLTQIPEKVCGCPPSTGHHPSCHAAPRLQKNSAEEPKYDPSLRLPKSLFGWHIEHVIDILAVVERHGVFKSCENPGRIMEELLLTGRNHRAERKEYYDKCDELKKAKEAVSSLQVTCAILRNKMTAARDELNK